MPCTCAIGELLRVDPHHCLSDLTSQLVVSILSRPDFDGRELDYTTLCGCVRGGFAAQLVALEIAGDSVALQKECEGCRGFAGAVRSFGPFLACEAESCIPSESGSRASETRVN